MGKKSKPPAAPDYTALAKQTADSQNQQIAAQTTANRPNQTNPYGSSQWTQGPDGQWSQNVSLSAPGQAQLDQGRQIGSGLLTQAGQAMQNPIDMSGMPGYSGYDTSGMVKPDYSNLGGGQFSMNPVGNSKAIQDAWMSQLQPQRDLARASEIQRLKNQGLTENSEAFQRGMTRLDQGDIAAQNQALIAGTQEYGNQFNRGMGQNAQNFGQNASTQQLIQALRGQQFGEQGSEAGLNMAQRQQQLAEQLTQRNSPLSEYGQLQGMLPQSPYGTQFTNAQSGQGVDYSTAGQNQYQAALADFNAKQAKRGGMLRGIGTIGGGILGGIFGGPGGAMLGSSVGGSIGGAFGGGGQPTQAPPYIGSNNWNGWSNPFSGGGQGTVGASSMPGTPNASTGFMGLFNNVFGGGQGAISPSFQGVGSNPY